MMRSIGGCERCATAEQKGRDDENGNDPERTTGVGQRLHEPRIDSIGGPPEARCGSLDE
jgi:hypothetical protein